MLLNAIASPDQLKFLTKAVDDHCRSRGIRADSFEYGRVAGRVMELFQSGGAGTAEEFAAVLAADDPSKASAAILPQRRSRKSRARPTEGRDRPSEVFVFLFVLFVAILPGVALFLTQ